ncbi:MAG: hypothetical protein KAJ51_03285 [Thermoplasmata archaeon]|nr:hypothetical protein [Thermoplasmata archaeon]
MLLRKGLNFFFTIIIVLIGIIPIISIEVQATGQPTAELRFEESVQEVDVQPGEDGKVVFNGFARAVPPPEGSPRTIYVDLNSFTNQGWTTNIMPALMAIEPGEEAPFTVEVEVPPETSSSINATLKVTGVTGSATGRLTYGVEPINGTILIKQYFNFIILCKNSFKESLPDSEEKFELDIRNKGNGRDRISFEVVNQDELVNKDLSVTLSQEQIELDENDNITIKVFVQAGKGTKCLGKHNILIKVYSEQESSENSIPQIYTLTIKITDEDLDFINVFTISSILFIVILLILIILWRRRINKKRKLNK